jgi:hypothetical protein
MKYTLIVILLAFVPMAIFSQAYSAVFKNGDTPTEIGLRLSWEEFIQKHEQLQAKNFELTDVETGKDLEVRYYFGLWKERKSPVNVMVKEIVGWDSLVMMKRKMADEQYVMQDIEAYAEGDKDVYLVTWSPGTTRHKVRKLTSWQGLMNDHEDLGRQELHMVDLEGFESADGKTNYLAIYHRLSPDAQTYPFRAPDPESFSTDKIYRNKSRFFLFDFEQFEKRGQQFLFGLYDAQRLGDTLIEAWDQEGLLEKVANYKEEGLELYDLDVVEY